MKVNGYRSLSSKCLVLCVTLYVLLLGDSGWAYTEVESAHSAPFPTTDGLMSKLFYPEWWGSAPVRPQSLPCRDPGKCITCHESNALMDPVHAIQCVNCHHGNSETEHKDGAHEGLISDPGDLGLVDRTCGKCHPEECRRVKRSPMALATRMINHTRFAFGAQESPESKYATVEMEHLNQLPKPDSSRNIGDDLLRRSCLRCHLHTRGSKRWGEHRGKGCSACHTAYPNSSSQINKIHGIFRNIGINTCLKCHNANHVGSDFVGLYEKDFNRGFRSPLFEGRQVPRIYGSEQHRLSPDVHYQAGMTCSDCHTLDEIHGTGEVPQTPCSGVKISCEGCHVTGEHPALFRSDNGEMTLLRGAGRKIPAWDPNLIPHKIPSHRERLRCSACHAAWSFQDYGLHLMIEERPDYWKWSINSAQNDPQVQHLLLQNIGTAAEIVLPREGTTHAKPLANWKPPTSTDWLSGETRPGAWFRGFTFRRWLHPPLGFDQHERISVMRPKYQYVISHVDAEDNLLLDRWVPDTGGGFPAFLFNPYAPHTIATRGRNCHECHGNPKAAGLGEGFIGIDTPGFYALLSAEDRIPWKTFRWDALVNEKGVALQRSSMPGARPLDPDTLARLLKPSQVFRTNWYKYLMQHRPD